MTRTKVKTYVAQNFLHQSDQRLNNLICPDIIEANSSWQISIKHINQTKRQYSEKLQSCSEGRHVYMASIQTARLLISSLYDPNTKPQENKLFKFD